MKALLAAPPWGQWLVLLPLGAVLLVAAITDFRARKVYNWLTYPAFFVGLLAHGAVFGLGGLGAGLGAGFLALVIGLFILPLGFMGGGDIKLLAVVGAFLGFGGLGEVFFYSVLAGGVLGLGMAAANGYLWTVLARMGRLLRGWWRWMFYRTPNVLEPMERDPRSHMPFAIAIFAGGGLAFLDAFIGWPGWLTLVLGAYGLH